MDNAIGSVGDARTPDRITKKLKAKSSNPVPSRFILNDITNTNFFSDLTAVRTILNVSKKRKIMNNDEKNIEDDQVNQPDPEPSNNNKVIEDSRIVQVRVTPALEHHDLLLGQFLNMHQDFQSQNPTNSDLEEKTVLNSSANQSDITTIAAESKGPVTGSLLAHDSSHGHLTREEITVIVQQEIMKHSEKVELNRILNAIKTLRTDYFRGFNRLEEQLRQVHDAVELIRHKDDAKTEPTDSPEKSFSFSPANSRKSVEHNTEIKSNEEDSPEHSKVNHYKRIWDLENQVRQSREKITQLENELEASQKAHVEAEEKLQLILRKKTPNEELPTTTSEISKSAPN